MFNTSEEIRQAIDGSGRRWKLKAVINGTEYYDLKDFVLKQSLMTDDLSFGNANISTLTGTFCNITNDVLLKGQQMEFYAGIYLNNLDDTSIQYIKLGVFSIVTTSKVDNKVTVTAYDAMYKTDVGYFTDLSGVKKYDVVIADLCKKAGLVNNVKTLDANVDVEKLKGLKIREALGYLASYRGWNAVIDRDGKLIFRGLTYGSVKDIKASRFSDPLTIGESNIKIGKLVCATGKTEEDPTYEAGDGIGKTVNFSNPLMNQTQLTNIYNGLQPFNIRTCSLNMTMGDPTLDIGDLITVIDRKGNSYKVPIFNITITMSGGLQCKIENRVKDDSETAYQFQGSLTTRVDRNYTEYISTKELLADSIIAYDGKFQTIETDFITVNNTLKAHNGIFETIESDVAKLKQADIDNLNAINGRFETIESKYITSEQVSAQFVTTKYLEANYMTAEKADIKYLTVEKIEGQYVKTEHLEANYLTAKEIETEYLTALQISTKYLDAEQIKAQFVTTKHLEANYITAENADIKYLTFDKLEGKYASIEYLKANYLTANDIKTKYLTAQEIQTNYLTAQQIKTDYLTAEDIKTTYLTSVQIETQYLKASQAEITYLKTDTFNTRFAEMGELVAGKATITDLNAAKGQISVLETQVGTIDTIINRVTTSDSIHSLLINADTAVIDSGFFKSLISTNIKVGDLLAGDISTTRFKVKSDSGNFVINDNTMQIKDSARVRVQIGKDGNNEYSLSLWDASGNLLWDARGLKASGIKDAIIRNDMVANDANIDGKKVNITSLVTEINGSTTTINANHILYDGKSLDVAFNSMQSSVTTVTKTVTDNKTKWDTASTNASNAVTTANQAKTTADTAKSTATDALTKASSVETRANSGEFDGKGIKSNAVTYQASASGTTAPTGIWTATIPTVGAGQYLWTRTIITYTDNTTSTAYSVAKMAVNGTNGSKGDKGDTGATGNGITGVTTYYLASASASGVTTSTSGWTTTPQSVSTSKKYHWSYQIIAYTNGSKTTTTPAIIGVYGDTGAKGATGATGKGINSVTPQYYLSTSNTTQADGSWKTTQDAWSTGKYYWTRDAIVWSDNTTTYTTPTLAVGLNNANANAQNAITQITTVTETVKTHSTQITTQEGKIGTLITDTAQVKKDITAVRGEVTTAKGNITTLQTNYSSLQQTVSGLSSKVGEHTSQLTTIKGTADSALSLINGLEIGGRNYIVLSKIGAYVQYNSVPTVSGTTLTSTWNSTWTSNTFTIQIYEFTPENKVYTVSGYLKVNGEIPSAKYFTGLANTYGSSLEKNEYDTTTGYFVITQMYPKNSPWIFHAPTTRTSKSSDVVTIDKLKFEEGNKATDWTPAPEDVTASIATVDGRITTEVKKVTDKQSSFEQSLTAITGRVSSTESTVSTVKSTVDTNKANWDKAPTALSTANTAKTTADTAKSTADQAKTTATTASTTANTAKSTADTAKSTAETAKTTATTASTNATNAVNTANTAKSTADSAKATATTANNTANSAVLATKVQPLAGTSKLFKNVASYSNDTSNQKGAFVIVTPITPNRMCRFHITGYNYFWQTNNNIDLTITCYNFNDSVTNCSYTNDGNVLISSIKLAKVSATDKRLVIILGGVTDTWQYPKLTVETALVSYTNVPPDSWKDGWSISLVTTLSTDYIHTVNVTGMNVQSEITTVKTKESALELTVDKFKATVSENYATKTQLTTVDGKFASYATITAMNSAISASASDITSTVSKTYATQTQLGTANSNISSLTTRVTTAEQKITDTAIVSTVTASQSWSTLNNKATDAQTKANNLVDLTTVKDTRSANSNPQWYFTNYPKKTVKEFKTCTAIGITGESTYGTLETTTSWGEQSGGYPVQLFYPNNSQNIYRRVGTSTTAWGAWTKVAGSHNIISSINQTAETIKIQASKIELTGAVTFSTFNSDVQNKINAKAEKVYHTTSGVSGTAGYVLLCQMVIKSQYQNQPIEITTVQRGRRPSTVWITFTSGATLDPTLNSLRVMGDGKYYIVKNTTSTWDLYLQKSEAYDNISVIGFNKGNYMGGTSVTWKTTQVDTLPAGYVSATQMIATAEWCYDNDITYINGGKIYTGSVTASQIASNAITTDKLSANAVTAVKIAAGVISATHIASKTITADKLVAKTLTAASGVFADACITTANIANASITTAKIANLAVTNAQIADATIQSAKIAALDAGKITTGYLNAARIQAGTITADKIKAGALSLSQFNTETQTLINNNKVEDLAGTAKVFKNVASYSNDNANIKGAFVITTPILPAKMFRFRITGYNYVDGVNSDIDITVTGYTYANSIVKYSYTNSGNVKFSSIKLAKVSSSDTRLVIILGSVTDTWQYTKLLVESALVSYSTNPPDTWKTGWSIALVTTLSTDYIHTVTLKGSDIQSNLTTVITKAASLESDLNGFRSNVTKSYATKDEMGDATGEVVKTLTTAIDQTEKNITETLESTYVVKSDYDDYVEATSTEIKKTAEDITFTFKQSKELIDKLEGKVNTNKEEITKFIRFIDGYIHLGEANSDFTLTISNDRISFKDNGSEVAYISNSTMYITNANVTNSLRIGKFAFVPRANGNLSIKLVN